MSKSKVKRGNMMAENGSAVLQSAAEKQRLAKEQKNRTEAEIAEIKAHELEQNAIKYRADKVERAERLERQKRKQAEWDSRQAERQ